MVDALGDIRYIGAEESSDITVTSALTTVIDFVLGDLANNLPNQYGRITGTIHSLIGDPLSNIAVKANLIRGGEYSLNVQTNGEGEYDLGYLTPGDYRIEFRDYSGRYAPQYYANAILPKDATTLTVVAGHLISQVNASLQVGAVITGKALVLDQAPLADGNVTAYVADAGLSLVGASAYIQPTGIYTLTGLASGLYHICASGQLDSYSGYFACHGGADVEHATAISVSVGNVYSNINITFGAGEFEAEISGIVTDTNGQLPNIRVDLFESGANMWVYSTQTDEQGRYRVPGLPNRTYTVRFVDPTGHYATTYYPRWQAPQSIEIHSGEKYRAINATMTAGGTIQGTIFYRSDEATKGAAVIPYRYTNGEWEFIFDTATTDANGHYRLQGLLPGEYHIESVRTVYPVRDARFYGNTYFLSDSPVIVVEAGQVINHIDITFYPERVYLPIVNR